MEAVSRSDEDVCLRTTGVMVRSDTPSADVATQGISCTPSGNWNRSVKVPSGRRLIFRPCTLILASGSVEPYRISSVLT